MSVGFGLLIGQKKDHLKTPAWALGATFWPLVELECIFPINLEINEWWKQIVAALYTAQMFQVSQVSQTFSLTPAAPLCLHLLVKFESDTFFQRLNQYLNIILKKPLI